MIRRPPLRSYRSAPVRYMPIQLAEKNMKTRNFTLMIVGVLLLSGCTTQLATRAYSTGDESLGVVYYLPRVEMKVNVSRELLACSVGVDKKESVFRWAKEQYDVLVLDEDKSRLVREIQDRGFGDILGFSSSDKPDRLKEKISKIVLPDEGVVYLPDLSVSIEAELSKYYIADSKKTYFVDYREMSGATKDTEFALEKYPNGTLKSINAKLDDQTAQVVGRIAKGAVTLAAATSGIPLKFDAKLMRPGLGRYLTYQEWISEKKKSVALCNVETRLLLEEKERAKNDLKVAISELAALESDSNNDGSAEVNKSTSSDADAKRKKALVLTRNVESAEKMLDSIRRKLTVKTTHYISEKDGGVYVAKQIDGKGEALCRWLGDRLTVDWNQDGVCKPSGDYMEKTAVLDVYAVFETALPQKDENIGSAREVRSDSSSGDGKKGYVPGLVYREPVQGVLRICAKAECVTKKGGGANFENIILSEIVDVPQLGVQSVLPLRNEAFENNALQASFSETGAVLSVTYRSNARAAKAASVFEETAQTYLEYRDARRQQSKHSLDTKSAEVQAEVDLLKARIELEQQKQKLSRILSGTDEASTD